MRWHPEVHRSYRCSTGHGFITSQSNADELDETRCTAIYRDKGDEVRCEGYLDGPYVDLFAVMKAEGYE